MREQRIQILFCQIAFMEITNRLENKDNIINLFSELLKNKNITDESNWFDKHLIFYFNYCTFLHKKITSTKNLFKSKMYCSETANPRYYEVQIVKYNIGNNVVHYLSINLHQLFSMMVYYILYLQVKLTLKHKLR